MSETGGIYTSAQLIEAVPDLAHHPDAIMELSNEVDNMLNITEDKEEKDMVQAIKVKAPLSSKPSAKDIFIWRLNNRYCMNIFALFHSDGRELTYDSTVNMPHGSQIVFTIKDIFFSSKKNTEFTRSGNFVDIDKFTQWFSSPVWQQCPVRENRTLTLTDLVNNALVTREDVDISKYLRPEKDNLMLNIFILFIAFSDRIATLSMFTGPGDEPEYFYKPGSADMNEVLEVLKEYKQHVFEQLVIKYDNKDNRGGGEKERGRGRAREGEREAEGEDAEQDVGHADKRLRRVADTIDVLDDLGSHFAREAQQEARGATERGIYCSIIVNCFLEAYMMAYYGAQSTNLEDGLDNDFYQHYIVKLVLLITMFVTLIKEALKQKKQCTKSSLFEPGRCKLATKFEKNNLTAAPDERKKAGLAKRRATAKKNKAAYEAQKIQQDKDKLAKREFQDAARKQRILMRTPGEEMVVDGGGSTKSVLYLVKIEKLRELNKKLRKNKTKNKNKIEKNNKQIDELKIKIKKEKAKEKLKKQKEKKIEKEKLKKEKKLEKEKLKKEKKIEKEKLKKEKLKKQKEKEKLKKTKRKENRKK